jgi:ribosomal protein S18 acetylase RimI-like enzyme
MDARRLEELAARAWPPLVADDVDGWVVRRAAGFTKRANSVWPREDRGDGPVEERLARVEELYAAEGLPACFFLGTCVAPGDLDERLARRGYVVADQSLVLVARLDGAAPGSERGLTPRASERGLTPRAARPDGPSSSPSANGDLTVRLAPSPDASWLTTWRTAAAVGEADARVALQLFGAAAAPTAFALARDPAGRPVAAGRGVLQGDALGIFNMGTVHHHRGRGAGSAVLQALMDHAAERGATTAYLQVSATNAPARRLYERAGFEQVARYAYRVQSRR